ncbi:MULTISPECIES: homoserine kinase [Microbacterium]|uniref:Homoserine kinase n=2 Tax=Microbacterium aurantiacum TaxID=162393 RepID=A0AAJ2HM58_9MICO|nr:MULTISPECIES: homoserine kinase [Microbacterium]ANG85334.1 homoserine kinase [Microbacterium chocolatum]KOS11045.1 serine kinase [Microbacterium chocolatum]MDN4463627.1 homoserine kinase [Microbacterium aurantiacum]MDS0246844.1 homoserine kinase [Microbacterium aurantiacum]
MTAPVAPEPGRRVLVRVPATSANLGPGFDTLGLALSIYDELDVTALPEGELEIDVEGEGMGDVPRDASHLVVRAIAYAYEAVGRRMPGLRLRARNVIPHGRGLGSSGAAVVSGLLAAKGLLRGDVEIGDETLLRLATELEGHPDNVAPGLFGGLTIAWVDETGPQHKKLIVHRGVSPLVFVPDFTMSTSVARSLQPLQVPREDAVFNVSRSALLIAALTQSPELLLAATEDKLHQSYRAQAMPGTDQLVRALRAEGFAAVVSGAGPSVLVLADGPGRRLEAAALAAKTADTPWEAHMLAVDVKGGTVGEYAESAT